jgi:hypothetical protein
VEIVTATSAVPLWTMRSIRRGLHFAAERRRKGEPASSMKAIRMFGASAGSRRGHRCL